MKKLDLTGCKYGRLTVLKTVKGRRKPNGSVTSFWLCKCECGVEKEVGTDPLRSGRAKSCGCYRDSLIGGLNYSHGMADSTEYKSWQHMKYRCLNPNSAKYADYGGRGIKICERWLNSFEIFYQDMGKKPDRKDTIDRIDVNGDYEPSNCRWASNVTQSNNQRNTVRYDFRGEQLTMSEISRVLGVPYKYFWNLFKKNGLSFDEIEIKYKRSI